MQTLSHRQSIRNAASVVPHGHHPSLALFPGDSSMSLLASMISDRMPSLAHPFRDRVSASIGFPFSLFRFSFSPLHFAHASADRRRERERGMQGTKGE